MRVLVTGGHGFVGAHVCRELLANGFEVQVLLRRALDSPPDSTLAEASIAVADLRDKAAVAQAVQSFAPGFVVHLAAHIAAPSPDGTEDWNMFEVNTQGTATLLQACTRLQPGPAIVYTLTMSVYDYEHPQYLPVDEHHPTAPTTAYGLSKQMAEMLCQHYARSRSAHLALLRLPGVYGPGRRAGLIYNLLVSASHGEEVRLDSLELRRDFIYVKDVARSILLAIWKLREGHSTLCNLSGGDVHMLSGLAEIAHAVVGRAPRVSQNGAPAASNFWFDPATAETELGFRPRTVKSAMEDFWASMN